MHPRIAIITLAVEDLERSVAFYRDGLGLATAGVASAEEGGDHALFELQDGLSLVLFARAKLLALAGVEGDPPRSPECIVSTVAANPEELDAILARAEAAGGAIPAAPHVEAWGYTGYFRDPDGHLWEVLCSSGST